VYARSFLKYVAHSAGMPQAAGTELSYVIRSSEPPTRNGACVVTFCTGRLSSACAVSEALPIATRLPPSWTNAASADQPSSPTPRAHANSSG
jgi:hypothetical protein